MINEKPHYLYKVTRSDGQFYIGVTTEPIRRFEEHRKGLGCPYLKNRNDLTLDILEEGFKSHIYSLEEYYITKLKPKLNRAYGGCGGDTGKAPKGEDAANSKLTDALVLEIRTRVSNGENYIELADEYNVTYPTIHAVCVGKTWKHVGGPLMNIKQARLNKIEEARALASKNIHYKEIADILNISVSSVYRYCRE